MRKVTVLLVLILCNAMSFGLGAVMASRGALAQGPQKGQTVYVDVVASGSKKDPTRPPTTLRGSHVVGFACTSLTSPSPFSAPVCFVASTDWLRLFGVGRPSVAEPC